jgi:hypothetical protein
MRLSLIALTTSLAVAAISAPVMKRNEDAEDLGVGLGVVIDKRNEDAEDLGVGLGVGIN